MKTQKFAIRFTQEQADQINAKIVEQIVEYGSVSPDMLNFLRGAEVILNEDADRA